MSSKKKSTSPARAKKASDDKKLNRPKEAEEKKINFQSVFENYCSSKSARIIPIVKVLSQPPKIGQEWKTYPIHVTPNETHFEVFIQNDYYEKEGTVQKVFIKNAELDDTIICALSCTITQYNTISVLRLINCNLLHEELYALYHILKKFPTITDLNIDENPNTKQNFFILLRKNSLQHLSMQKCKINKRALKCISYELLADAKYLITLDLSSNLIDDNAVAHLATALKVNRTLISLILTDNWITDKGLETLIKVFQDFELTQQEIEIRRKLNFEYEFKKIELQQQFKNEWKIKVSNLSVDTVSTRRKSKQGKSNSSVITKRSTKSRTSKASRSSRASYNDQMEIYLAGNLKKSDHPFQNECIAENGSIYCLGNFKLTYLNLSYNKITADGLPCIFDTLQHQIALPHKQDPGLTNIILGGNNINESPLLNEIKALLQEKIAGAWSRTDKGRRRSSVKAKTN